MCAATGERGLACLSEFGRGFKTFDALDKLFVIVEAVRLVVPRQPSLVAQEIDDVAQLVRDAVLEFEFRNELCHLV